jgi:MFS family permease
VVRSNEWGWSAPATIATIVGGLIALGVFVQRSRRAPNPLVDLDLFHLEGVRLGNLAMFAFAISFAAMFFGNIQFLTGVWGWSVLRAGFAVAPGPLMVAVLAPIAGRVAARRGQRVLLVPGGLIYAAGPLWLLTHATVVPDYVGVYLPSTILTGLGVALCLPQLSSVAVQQLPPDRSATGSAISQSVRQVGTTLGVALFVALIGTPGPLQVLERFHHVWLLIATGGVTVTLVATRLRRPVLPATSPHPSTDLVEVPA